MIKNEFLFRELDMLFNVKVTAIAEGGHIIKEGSVFQDPM